MGEYVNYQAEAWHCEDVYSGYGAHTRCVRPLTVAGLFPIPLQSNKDGQFRENTITYRVEKGETHKFPQRMVVC